MSQRILAIDYGLKRIGLAQTDRLGYSAQALPVLENTSLDEVLEHLERTLRDHEIGLVLVGLPYNMDGSEGPMAERVRLFISQLQEHIGDDIEIIARDERLTSWTAEKEEFAKGKLPWKDKGLIDTRAAMILLEDYLSEKDPRRGLLSEEGPILPAPEKSRRRDKFNRGRRPRGRGRRSGR